MESGGARALWVTGGPARANRRRRGTTGIVDLRAGGAPDRSRTAPGTPQESRTLRYASAVDARTEGITRLLRAAAGGDHEARASLVPLLYDELRALAHARLARAGARRELETTELVHEAWLRLVPAADMDWESRRHFFGVAARAMRNVLVEEARRRLARKRDGTETAEGLELLAVAMPLAPEDVLALNEAIERFGSDHPGAAEIVAQRFFNGLTMPEVADVLGISLATAEREWRFARAWLRQVLEHEPRE